MNDWIDHPSFPDQPTPSDWTYEPTALERFGLTFIVVWDPDRRPWLRVADSDGRVIAFEPVLLDDTATAVIDDWIERRLGEVTPDRRCDECDLPVELAESLPPRALNLAVEIELQGGFVDRRERGHERITLCTTCLDGLRNRHEWFDRLLDAARARRRLR